MVKLPELNTAYALPFELIRAKGPVLSSGTGTVKVLLRVTKLTTEVGAAAQAVMDTFVQLAATGALAGDSVPAADSRANLSAQRAPGANELMFAGSCLLDERAYIVLAHMLLARQQELGLDSVRLLSDGASGYEPVPHDPDEDSTYPPAPKRAPFELEDLEPESGSVTFEVQFKRDVTPETLATFERACEVWTAAVRGGAYALAPMTPEESFLEPEPIETWDSTIEWTVFKLRADDAAIHAILCMMAALHKLQPLASLTIS